MNILTILALVVLSVVGALGDQGQIEGLLSPIDLAFLAAIVALLLFVVLKSELVVSRFAYWINYLRSIRKGREDAARIANEAKVRTSLIKVGRIETLFGFAAAILNWLFDLAVLFLMLHSTHSRISLLGVVLAYSVGALAANLPLTPGGLGVVEGSMAVALVAFGGHEVPS
ncbi:YpkG, partial [mine drainage metagenome]